jgi:hypothetical protein
VSADASPKKVTHLYSYCPVLALQVRGNVAPPNFATLTQNPTSTVDPIATTGAIENVTISNFSFLGGYSGAVDSHWFVKRQMSIENLRDLAGSHLDGSQEVALDFKSA